MKVRFDLIKTTDQLPEPVITERIKKGKGKRPDKTIQEVEDRMVIALSHDGLLIKGLYLSEQDRFSGFTKDCPPVAWQYWSEAKVRGK